MKKKFMSAILGAMMVLSLTACKSTAADKGSTATATDYHNYVTLADYKNISVDVDKSQLEVTQDDIQKEIDACLNAYAEVTQRTEGTVADGDSINLDFSGLLDGVAFSNGTATDYSYTVGGGFIEDLDRGLIGLEVGREYEIPCKFPENYGNDELNGKDVIFVVTVNYIEDKTLPEYNDEFVQKMTADSDTPMTTTKELEKSITDYLNENKKSTYDRNVYVEAMTYMLDNSQFTGSPDAEINATIDLIKSNAQAEYEASGTTSGVDSFEDYITKVAQYDSMDAFEEEVKTYATEYIQEKMIVTLIAEAEGIVITDDEAKEYATNIATQAGYDSYEALHEVYGETLMDDAKYELMYDKVYDVLVAYASADK